MKVGDLVKLKDPFPACFNKGFLITEWRIGYIKVLGTRLSPNDGWQRAGDFEVLNESR